MWLYETSQDGAPFLPVPCVFTLFISPHTHTWVCCSYSITWSLIQAVLPLGHPVALLLLLRAWESRGVWVCRQARRVSVCVCFTYKGAEIMGCLVHYLLKIQGVYSNLRCPNHKSWKEITRYDVTPDGSTYIFEGVRLNNLTWTWLCL